MGAKRNAYIILVEKLAGKRPLGRSRRRWKDNVKMDLKWDGVVWTGSGYESVEGSCENGNELSGYLICWEILEGLSDWRLLKKCSGPWS
jgi:hypothetical protein